MGGLLSSGTAAGTGSAGAGAAPAGALEGAAGATAATGGLAAPLLIGAGVGLTAYDLINGANQNKKQLKAVKKQQLINAQQKKNLLEERLAARRARVGSLGITSDGSETASIKKIAQDGFNDIAFDDIGYNQKSSEISDSYRDKMTRNLLESGINFAGKVLK